MSDKQRHVERFQYWADMIYTWGNNGKSKIEIMNLLQEEVHVLEFYVKRIKQEAYEDLLKSNIDKGMSVEDATRQSCIELLDLQQETTELIKFMKNIERRNDRG